MTSKSILSLTALLVLASLAQAAYIFVGQDSCTGRCDDRPSTSFDCQCNKPCETYGDCCNDYNAICVGTTIGSCKGKCDTTGTNATWPCQCNKVCEQYGDCCPDYDDECDGGGGETPGEVSNAEIISLTEELFQLEGANNAGPDVQVNLQGETTQGGTADRSPLPLLTVNSAALERGTIGLLRKLHDNYIPSVSSNEVITAEEQAEEEAFLDAVFATPLFQRFRSFLIEKGYLTESNFRDTFYQIWFGQYSRSGSTLGSSGFEHVFLGELKSGEVSGFHNWVFFNNEESSGNLNYNGYLKYGSFGEKGSNVGHNFVWRNNLKPISSMFIGTSPELELATFTLCWYARPNSQCTVQFNGAKFVVQTYDISSNGKKYVASSYADAI